MKIIRTSTVPGSLNNFCRGLLRELQEQEGYEVVAVSSPGEALTEIQQREGVRTVAVEMQRHISPLKDLRSLWKIIKVFRRERPTMVHPIAPKAGLLSMMAAWLCCVPVRVHTFTGLVFPTLTGLNHYYFLMASTCAIMAVCWNEHAGYKYLKENDAAFCVDSYDSILPQLQKIVDHPQLIGEYAEKAYHCGVMNHNKEKIQKQITDKFQEVITQSL